MKNCSQKIIMVLFLMVCLLIINAGGVFADELKGKITSVDAATNIVNVSGVLIDVSKAKIENEDNRPIKITDLAAGVLIEVDGTFTGGGKMTASRVEKDNEEADEIRGKIEKIDKEAKVVYIGGIALKIEPDSKIEGEDDDKPITFDQLVPGTLVEAEGKWTGDKIFTVKTLEID